MIYTVTLNPAIDETLEVEHLRPGATHRVLSRCRYAGGKGINVARALRVFAEDCVALTIAGRTAAAGGAALYRLCRPSPHPGQSQNLLPGGWTDHRAERPRSAGGGRPCRAPAGGAAGAPFAGGCGGAVRQSAARFTGRMVPGSHR